MNRPGRRDGLTAVEAERYLTPAVIPGGKMWPLRFSFGAGSVAHD